MELEYKAMIDADMAFDQARRTVKGYLSRETVDGQGEVLVADGADLSRYQSNPVVLWMHDLRTPPIGKAVDVQARPGDGVWWEWEAAPTAFGEQVFDLYQRGYLKAFSVGFLPRETDRGSGRRRVTQWEIMEGSAVTVPVNADALAKAAISEGNEFAALVLRHYYPDARDLNEAARLADAMRRVKGGTETILNYRRHCEKAGEEFPQELAEALIAVAPLCEELFTRSFTPPEPHPVAADLVPSEPHPTVTAGDPSEAVKAEQDILAQLAELRQMVAERRAEEGRARMDAARRAHIGRTRR